MTILYALLGLVLVLVALLVALGREVPDLIVVAGFGLLTAAGIGHGTKFSARRRARRRLA